MPTKGLTNVGTTLVNKMGTAYKKRGINRRGSPTWRKDTRPKEVPETDRKETKDTQTAHKREKNQLRDARPPTETPARTETNPTAGQQLTRKEPEPNKRTPRAWKEHTPRTRV